MAVDHAAADAKSFSLEALRGSTTNGISSNPFLEYAFRTDRYAITVTLWLMHKFNFSGLHYTKKLIVDKAPTIGRRRLLGIAGRNRVNNDRDFPR